MHLEDKWEFARADKRVFLEQEEHCNTYHRDGHTEDFLGLHPLVMDKAIGKDDKHRS